MSFHGGTGLKWSFEPPCVSAFWLDREIAMKLRRPLAAPAFSVSVSFERSRSRSWRYRERLSCKLSRTIIADPWSCPSIAKSSIMRPCSSILACSSDIRLSASIEAATVINLASAELPRSKDCIMRSIGETGVGIINAAPSSPACNFDRSAW